MNNNLALANLGTKKSDIDVRLSYKIVELFSEGLYSSPNKAIEELVANSFDAGALQVGVFLSDLDDQDATISVVDDGEGMDANGLKQHWLIGISNKRNLAQLPKGRQQIGKFGIGKLATYVLANRLSHVTKKSGKYYSTSMDFSRIDKRVEEGVEPKSPIKIPLRELSERDAQTALSPWIESAAFKASGIKLFGKGSSSSWTYAILSDLKDKAHEIRPGVLEWVLRTALPLRDDFAVFLNGSRLKSSKAEKGRINRWTLGKDVTELPTPAPKDLEAYEDKNEPSDSGNRFGLIDTHLGRITGYAEAYQNPLESGKSHNLGRSHGFFVYVLGRLINVTDGHFGIKPDELRHGTFNRIRVVVHINGLDAFLQSDRERIREGPALAAAQNILRGIFNYVRPVLAEHDAGESLGVKLSRKLAASPGSLARRPIVEMVRAALKGKVVTRYILLPSFKSEAERQTLLELLETRAEDPEQFVGGLEFIHEGTSEDPIAAYEAATGVLKVNGLHPFIGAFFDGFSDKSSGIPLEVFAMAEVLLESHLHQAGLGQDELDGIMFVRDQILRNAARESGRMTPLMVASALRNARNDQNELEIWVVEAFRSLGFEATRIGKSGNPDGIAEALLGPDVKRQPQRFKVSLEAKSKESDGTKVSAKAVGIAGVARHRKKYQCQHALVVGQSFPTAQAEKSALAKEIAEDRRLTNAAKDPRTITLIRIDDLARLVQLRPLRALTLQRIRQMLLDNALPEECKKWIEALIAEKPIRHDYATIVNAIARLQSGPRNEPVEYGELRAELRHGTPKIDYTDINELKDVCRTMGALVPSEIDVTARMVSLNQAASNVLAKLNSATKEHRMDSL